MSDTATVGALGEWATERLEAEISVLAAHLAAAECRWMELVAEFDRREAWASWGCASAAHWLNFRCGIDIGAARERVRVARRLAELPLVAASFATGQLSYSKVRALTRVATAANEERLVELACSMTASHLERTVRCYRRVTDEIDSRDYPVPDRYASRFLSTRWNDDGCLEIRARLPPVEGEMVLAALRRAADVLYRAGGTQRGSSGAADVSAETPDNVDAANAEGSPSRADVSAETPDDVDATRAQGSSDPADVPAGTPRDADTAQPESSPGPADVPAETPDDVDATRAQGSPDPDDVSAETPDDVDATRAQGSPDPDDVPAETSYEQRQADALVAMAETVVADGLRPGSGPNRHTVVVHAKMADLAGDPSAEGPFLENGPVLARETVRRLMCDSSLMFALEGPDGAVINVSRRAATIPSALARAVKLRDRGCVFPGCTRHAFVDIHHVQHRADQGENTMANCALLCRAHHRLVHEGGFTMATESGQYRFRRPDGTLISVGRTIVPPGDRHIRDHNTERGIRPTDETTVPDWDGIRPDYPGLIDLLLDLDRRLRDDPPRNN